MKFDIFATLTCVSRPCFDFSVIFFTPSSTLDSVIGSYVSVTIIVFNVLILICGSLLYLSPRCDFNFKPAVWVLSFWLLGFASSGPPGFKMMLCKNYGLWSSYSTYISQRWLFNHASHYWRCFEEKGRRLLFNTRRPQTWRKTGWRHCFAEKASYNFFFSLRKLPQSRKNGLEAFLWRPSLQNVLFKCTFGREGAKVTDNHNVHRNSSF